MTWEEAIHKVLEECPEPLHYADIAERVVNENLVEYKGSAPAVGAASVLSTHISAGKGSFKKLGGGLYTLTDKAIADDEERDVIVACFGMFWERSRITWSTTPSISGMQYIGSDPVDFCNQVGVYLLYDGREVVYVGRTIDRPLGRRIFEHTRDRLRTRWNRFSWFGLLPVLESGNLGNLSNSFSAAKMIPTLEAVLIEALEPRQNRKRGDDMSAVEYIQEI